MLQSLHAHLQLTLGAGSILMVSADALVHGGECRMFRVVRIDEISLADTPDDAAI